MNQKEALSAVKNTVEQYSQQILEVGEHVWKNPEPGYREEKWNLSGCPSNGIWL